MKREEFDAPEDKEGADDQEGQGGADDRKTRKMPMTGRTNISIPGICMTPTLMTECIAEDIARFMELAGMLSQPTKEWMAPPPMLPRRERMLAKSILSR